MLCILMYIQSEIIDEKDQHISSKGKENFPSNQKLDAQFNYTLMNNLVRLCGSIII